MAALSSSCCSFRVKESLLAISPPVAGVVVLYRPGAEVLENIGSYLDQVEVLYAVDNTEEPEAPLVSALRGLPKVSYVWSGRNLGVAAALNVGACRAKAGGYEWLLTMDQDSRATSGMVAAMLRCQGESAPADLGLISPFHVQVGGAPREPRGRCVQVFTPMTSGCVVSLSAYEAVGPFMEELFIDQVDNEFCLRLRTAGFCVLEAGEATLIHKVGDVRRHRFPLPMYTTGHPPVRRYYMTRNRFYVGRMYRGRFPEFRRFELREVAKDVVKILLYEDAKRAKFRMMARGYRDYRLGRLGAYVPSA
jgi:rhamnosyltransferase